MIVFLFARGSYSQNTKAQRILQDVSDLLDNSKYDLVEKKLDTLLVIAKEEKMDTLLAEYYNLHGTLNKDQSKIKEAIYDYSKAVELYEILKIPNSMAGTYINIGTIYNSLGEYKKALSYYFKAMKIYQAGVKSSNVGILYNNIGTSYQKQQQYSSSNIYLQKAFKIAQATGDSMLAAMSTHNLGINYSESKNYDTAIVYYNNSLNYIKNYSEGQGHIFNCKQLGEAYYHLNKLDKAEENLLRAVRISNEIGYSSGIEDIYDLLSDVYEAKKDYKKALVYNRIYTQLKDSLSSEAIKTGIIKAQYETEMRQQKKMQDQEQKNRDLISQAKIDSQKKIIMASLIALAVVLVLVIFVLRGYNAKRKANLIISKQKEIVELKQKEILSSIYYAKRIQNALLTSENYFRKRLEDFFILYKPKDIVSGDFYWGLEHKGLFYLIVADCTGHGVPGAFMSLLNISILNELIIEKGISTPDQILNEARKEIIRSLNPEGGDESKDGMDCILCAFDFKKSKLQYACANNSFFLKRGDELIISETDKMPVGLSHDNEKSFTLHEMEIRKNDVLFLITDGYADQFGGPKGKKFKYKQLQEVLLRIGNSDIELQKKELNSEFENWKGQLEQVDDVCVIGIKI
jgi:serine phosphatase RsbU (regulator of sigma subunit)/Tfp pilus assembly protein PilF